jgi:hypothetical protein
MLRINEAQSKICVGLIVGLLSFVFAPAAVAVGIEGQVEAGGGPLASSTVTLWAASAGEPKQLAQTKSSSDGRFKLGTADVPGKDVVMYVVPKVALPRSKKAAATIQPSHC